MVRNEYIEYIRAMAAHGERRLNEVSWIFDSLETSLSAAQKNLAQKDLQRMRSSLTHAYNLANLLKHALSDLPDKRLVKHIHELLAYIDSCVERCQRFPIDSDLVEMRALLAALQKGWLHLVSPIRGLSRHGSDIQKLAL